MIFLNLIYQEKKSLQAEHFQTGKKMLARPFSCENGDISVGWYLIQQFHSNGSNAIYLWF